MTTATGSGADAVRPTVVSADETGRDRSAALAWSVRCSGMAASAGRGATTQQSQPVAFTPLSLQWLAQHSVFWTSANASEDPRTARAT